MMFRFATIFLIAFSFGFTLAKPDPVCTNKYQNCCLTTGVCPSSSCVSSLNYPNDARDHCDKDCQAKTDCVSIIPGCDASGDVHCLGKIMCVGGTNCDGNNENDYCLYDGNSKNYKICHKNTGGVGDPQFVGLQYQSYQIHGVPDEYFNILTTPTIQVNAHFHYMSNGRRDFNHTVGWTHPGTYMNKFGIMIGNNKIEAIAHSHTEGMHVEINEEELSLRKLAYVYTNDKENTLYLENKNLLSITTNEFIINIINADMFFNFEITLVNQNILQTGSDFMKISDEVCNLAHVHKPENSPIRAEVLKYFPEIEIHGLVGQTWKNIDYCGNVYEGEIDDYITDGKYGTNFPFNYFSYIVNNTTTTIAIE